MSFQNPILQVPAWLRGSAAAALLAAALAPAPAAAITFNVFTDPHPVVSGGTIGFSYAGDKFVGTVQKDGTNVMYQTDLNGGNVQVFAPGVSLPASQSSEHFIASSLGDRKSVV